MKFFIRLSKPRMSVNSDDYQINCRLAFEGSEFDDEGNERTVFKTVAGCMMTLTPQAYAKKEMHAELINNMIRDFKQQFIKAVDEAGTIETEI